MLLELKVNVNHADGNETPLIAAINTNDYNIFNMIMKARPNINTPGKDGKDPLYLSVEKGNFEIFKELVANGADITKTYHDGQTLLHIASSVCHYDIVKYLLTEVDEVLQPDQPDEKGNTPLFFAVMNSDPDAKEDKFKIIEDLLYLGCDPSQTNRAGKCPYTMADRETIEVIGTIVQDPKVNEAMLERKEYWLNIEQQNKYERMSQRESARSEASQRMTTKNIKSERAKRNATLATMTLRGGTLRIEKGKNAAPHPTKDPLLQEVRPWGGSKETEQFQKNIRIRIVQMKHWLQEQLDTLLEDAKQIRNSVFPDENYDYSSVSSTSSSSARHHEQESDDQQQFSPIVQNQQEEHIDTQIEEENIEISNPPEIKRRSVTIVEPDDQQIELEPSQPVPEDVQIPPKEEAKDDSFSPSESHSEKQKESKDSSSESDSEKQKEPKAEEPEPIVTERSIEIPQKEAPKTEEPKAEPPKPEGPKAKAPKPEAPKAKAPKTAKTEKAKEEGKDEKRDTNKEADKAKKSFDDDDDSDESSSLSESSGKKEKKD